ncbi:von Willebrand factor A domain-containing protein 2-like [Haliotis rufescens]|uniref:von Willebrand factor A domain-containing protein 2-like n=1 Tax=Haliotis rufescens TaxID=6454 RepID=UPI001EB01BA5|nr:von Willebrand factor A domain-containing protein 2-like [Haliotis rufescens]XP_046347901.1 von Willebrand factor A domain-containing protein 2-like [Haliotis rufescens]XP_048252307.1 von Willebrand factor A domain-containing protein 2-like [Haliotis rufescens]
MERLVLLFITVGTVLSLDCSGPADIVIAVPGSETVPKSQFRFLENFLTQLVSYYNIARDNTRVGLVLYGREPVVIADLHQGVTRQTVNSRITLLSQRKLYTADISGGQNVPKAIQKVHKLLSAGRGAVPKIGVIMTYGGADLTSPDAQTVIARISSASAAALNDGINLFATNTGGGLPGFVNITMDTCRLFSLGNYDNLETLLPYLASSTCYVLDPSVNPSPLQCFPDVQSPPPQEMFQCQTQAVYVADPQNCAYYYVCPMGIRMLCAPGSLFDPIISRCNSKEAVSCYTGVTCPAPKGLFPHPWDNTKFLSCSQNIPYVNDCPGGLVFYPLKSECDYPDNSVATSY